MKGDRQVSPVAAGIIIAVIAVVVIFIGVRFVRGPSRVELSPEQVKQMQEMGHGRPMAGGRVQVSGPPAGVSMGK